MLEDVRPLVTALITAAVTIVGLATPLVAAWLKSYFAVRENAAMNQTVAAAASREAAMLLSCSTDIRQIKVGDPDLMALAQDLVQHYPEYTSKLGLDLDRSQRLILGEAHKLYNTSLVPVAAVSAAVAPPEAKPDTRLDALLSRFPK